MTLAESLLRQLADPSLSHDEQTMLRCQVAGDLEYRGQYDVARDVLGGLWRGVGREPALEGLQELTRAEVLLRVGALSGWLGSIDRLAGAQDAAKDLISESLIIFQRLGEPIRAAVAQSELGYCYWREGAADDARVLYTEALRVLPETEPELRAKVLLRLAEAEYHKGRLEDTLHLLTESADLFAANENPAIRGRFYSQRACVLMLLGQAARSQEYIDQAIMDYTAASVYFEEAGHTSYRARTENNLGFLLYQVARYDEAHVHLRCARQLFTDLKDYGSAAQVDETRARTLLAEGKVEEAAKVIAGTVRVLNEGGEQGVLTEALTTQGLVLARLGAYEQSLDILQRAISMGEQAGALEYAGKAALTLLEEHAGRRPHNELFEVYQRADDLFARAKTRPWSRACGPALVD